MMRTVEILNNQVRSAQLEHDFYEGYYCPHNTSL
jgi:hypothetical protein